MVRDTPPYGHAPTYHISLTYLERQKSYGPDKLRWEEAEAEAEEAEEKIRLKQYVSLRSKGRHNKHYGNVVICFWKVWKEKLMRTKNGDIIYVHMTCFWNNLYRVRLTGKPTNLKKKLKKRKEKKKKHPWKK